MKKIIYLTMIIISLAMCLCGCTKKNQEGQLSKIYKVPQKLIYINAPSTYEETQNGYSKIYFVKNKKYIAITAEQEKTEKINEIEMYRYEGKLICGRTVKASAYVVGYTFIIDKIPCNITGVVTEKEQNEESIQEIKSLVDEMARTVRNTKDNIMD